MTHRMEVLIRLMSRRVKIAYLLIAKVKERIWPVKRPLAMVVEGENSWSNGLVLLAPSAPPLNPPLGTPLHVST